MILGVIMDIFTIYHPDNLNQQLFDKALFFKYL